MQKVNNKNVYVFRNPSYIERLTYNGGLSGLQSGELGMSVIANALKLIKSLPRQMASIYLLKGPICLK